MMNRTMRVRRVLRLGCVALIAAGVGAGAARAEILSLSGSARASVQEIRFGADGDFDQAADQFPATAAFPLQVVATLEAAPPEDAGGTVAAQFADPSALNQANPEEFAMNLGLSSVSANTRYVGRAEAEEKREVVFSPIEVGAPEGTTIPLVGRLFIDGALTIFAVEPDRDLSGSRVTLEVRVDQQVGDLPPVTVFRGVIDLLGEPGGQVSVVADGDFPTTALLLTNLALGSDLFGVFHVLIIPDLEIDYRYEAVVGQPFTLRASVVVDAENIEDMAGVAAVIGTPTTALTQVITATFGDTAAAKMLTALEQERSQPTGVPAIPVLPPPAPLFPFCGLLGFESLLLFSALAFVRSRRQARSATQ